MGNSLSSICSCMGDGGKKKIQEMKRAPLTDEPKGSHYSEGLKAKYLGSNNTNHENYYNIEEKREEDELDDDVLIKKANDNKQAEELPKSNDQVKEVGNQQKVEEAIVSETLDEKKVHLEEIKNDVVACSSQPVEDFKEEDKTPENKAIYEDGRAEILLCSKETRDTLGSSYDCSPKKVIDSKIDEEENLPKEVTKYEDEGDLENVSKALVSEFESAEAVNPNQQYEAEKNIENKPEMLPETIEEEKLKEEIFDNEEPKNSPEEKPNCDSSLQEKEDSPKNFEVQEQNGEQNGDEQEISEPNNDKESENNEAHIDEEPEQNVEKAKDDAAQIGEAKNDEEQIEEANNEEGQIEEVKSKDVQNEEAENDEVENMEAKNEEARNEEAEIEEAKNVEEQTEEAKNDEAENEEAKNNDEAENEEAKIDEAQKEEEAEVKNEQAQIEDEVKILEQGKDEQAEDSEQHGVAEIPEHVNGETQNEEQSGNLEPQTDEQVENFEQPENFGPLIEQPEDLGLDQPEISEPRYDEAHELLEENELESLNKQLAGEVYMPDPRIQEGNSLYNIEQQDENLEGNDFEIFGKKEAEEKGKLLSENELLEYHKDGRFSGASHINDSDEDEHFLRQSRTHSGLKYIRALKSSHSPDMNEIKSPEIIKSESLKMDDPLNNMEIKRFSFYNAPKKTTAVRGPYNDIWKKDIPDYKMKRLATIEKYKAAMEKLDNPNQTNLILHLNDFKEIDDDAVFHIARLLVDFKNLFFLELNFQATSMTDQGLQSIAAALKGKKIQQLELWIGHTHVSDLGMKMLAEALISFSINEIELILNLRNTRISDKGVDTLSKSFKELKNLECFWLNLSETKITDKSVKHICEAITHIKMIQEFTLHLQKTAITDKCFKTFSKCFLNMKHCNKINLYISDTKVSEKAKATLKNSDFRVEFVN